MNSPDDFDEVVPNALLAEGGDLPTLLEANRRDVGAGNGAVHQGCLVAVAVVVAVVIAARR